MTRGAESNSTSTTTTTAKPRLNKGFKPKFVRILTQDEVNKSNEKSDTIPRKFRNRNRGRYGPIENSPIQMIYKVEEVPIHKVKPFVPCTL